MLLAGRREFLLGPIGHVADLSLVLAEAVRLIRDVTLEEEVEEALKAEVGAAR